MEAATKNKRGRPPKFHDTLYTLIDEKGRRAAQNTCYAVSFIERLDEAEKGFFLFPDGRMRRQSIAEQLGRMIASREITEEQGRDLAAECIREYADGASVKSITAGLSRFRKAMK